MLAKLVTLTPPLPAASHPEGPARRAAAAVRPENKRVFAGNPAAPAYSAGRFSDKNHTKKFHFYLLLHSHVMHLKQSLKPEVFVTP